MIRKNTMLIMLCGAFIFLTGGLCTCLILRRFNQNETKDGSSNLGNLSENKSHKNSKSEENKEIYSDEDIISADRPLKVDPDKIEEENNNINSFNDARIKNPKELEEFLLKTERYIKPALRYDEYPDFATDNRTVEQLIAACFVHIKLTTAYFEELSKIVFGNENVTENHKILKGYLQFINSYIIKFFEKTDAPSIRSIYDSICPISHMVCWVYFNNYSEKFDDLANKIIKDFPTESKILEDEVLVGINLNVVQLTISKVVKLMTEIIESEE